MSEIEILEVPLVKPKVKIDKTTRHKLLNQINEESQVIVHCTYTGTRIGNRIRIWKSIFLYPKGSTRKSKLIHQENITLFPTWMPVPLGQTIIFTLIFTALPKHCKQFDLIEKIPEPGGFEMRNIARNETDIYFVDLTRIH